MAPMAEKTMRRKQRVRYTARCVFGTMGVAQEGKEAMDFLAKNATIGFP